MSWVSALRPARLFDAVIQELSPVWGQKRMAARLRYELLKRAHEAGKNDRLSGRGRHTSSGPNEKGKAEREPALRQARDLYRINPFARGGVNSIVANLVGCGIRPQARVMLPRLGEPDDAFNDLAEAAWKKWAARCDKTGRRSFYRQQAVLQRELIVAGEAFAILSEVDDGREIPLAVDIVAAERISSEKDDIRKDGTKIIQGIEFNRQGGIAAYHILPEHPGDLTGWKKPEPERVPAERVLHLYDELEPAQVRGITRFMTIAGVCEAIPQWLDWVLAKERTASALAIMITQSLPGMNFLQTGQEEEDEEGNRIGQLEGGMFIEGRPGEDIKGVASTIQAANVDQLLTVFLRLMSRGLEVPFEVISGDLSHVTYLSARQGENQARRHWEPQQEYLNDNFNIPIWSAFIQRARVARIFRIPDAQLERYSAVDFVRPGWDWIDPSKDVASDIEAIKAGLRSPLECITKRGGDPWKVLQDCSAFKKWSKGLDLSLSIHEEPAALISGPDVKEIEPEDDTKQKEGADVTSDAA